MNGYRYAPRPPALRPRARLSVRLVAARSAALLRAVTDPGRVLAWLCQRCGRWVDPAGFAVETGMCRACTGRLNRGGGGDG